MAVIKNTFWKNVDLDWAGPSSDITFSHPFFSSQAVEVFLGDEFDEEGEEVEEVPSDELLNEFEKTYKDFTENIEDRLQQIQTAAFEHYQKLYAHYYENEKKSGEKPLQITSVEKHNPYIKELMYIRISEGNTLRLPIRYGIDEEHGIEFKFVDGKINKVDGIAET